MLVSEEKITRDQLARAMAIRMGVGFFTLTEGVDPAVARLIDEKTARRYQAVPVRMEGEGRLVVAMADPSNVFAIDDLRILTRHEIRPVLAGVRGDPHAARPDLAPRRGGRRPGGGERRRATTRSTRPTSPTRPTTPRWCGW